MGDQPKKLLILQIYDILKKYSDAEHPLSQQKIIELLREEYGVEVERKAIRRNLMNLAEFDHRIRYTKSTRNAPNAKAKDWKSTVATEFYFLPDFDDTELRFLIDSVLYSPCISANQKNRLVKKIENLSSTHFRSRVKHVGVPSPDAGDNQQIFYSIEQLDEAIGKGKKVRFQYLEYDLDKKLHPKTRSGDTPIEYTVTPYQMAVREGKYYLICCHDHNDNLSNCRIDRISEIAVLDEPGKPFRDVKDEPGDHLDLMRYMKEHPYMYSGETIRVWLRIVREMVGDVIDLFGKDVTFSDEDDTHVTVTVCANKLAIEHFAKSYAQHVIVLEPKGVRESVKKSLEEAAKKYN